MAAPGDVINVEQLTIGNIFVFPDAAAGGDFSGVFDFIKEQLAADADPRIMRDCGYPVDEEAVVEPEDEPSPDEQAELEGASAEGLAARFVQAKVEDRAKYLHRVAEHITTVRHLEGLRKQPGHTPKQLEALDERHDDEMGAAALALSRACELCDFRDGCKLADDAGLWTDAHPYQRDRTGKRRAGTSTKIKVVESRVDLLAALDAGVEATEQVHCDPAERELEPK